MTGGGGLNGRVLKLERRAGRGGRDGGGYVPDEDAMARYARAHDLDPAEYAEAVAEVRREIEEWRREHPGATFAELEAAMHPDEDPDRLERELREINDWFERDRRSQGC